MRSGRGRHVIDKNLALLRPLGIEAVGLREFPLPFSVEAVARVDAGALGPRRRRARGGSTPAGGWASKLSRPAERYGELAKGLRDLGLRPLVSWGPGEEGLADRVVAASGGAAARSFPTTLLDYVEIARRARLVVAADTGPLHLACAVGTPVVALFGPTDPARNGPFATDDVVVRRASPVLPATAGPVPAHVALMGTLAVAEVLAAGAQAPCRGAEQGARMPLRVPRPRRLGGGRPRVRARAIRLRYRWLGPPLRSSARRCGSGPRATSRDQETRHRGPLRTLAEPSLRR